jgi:protein ImuA
MIASRRLQLAAEGSGVIGLALRRWRRQAQAAEFRRPTAATTRWRVNVLPSTPLPVLGIGRARWRLKLIRCRRGESAEFEVEACDAQGRLAAAQAGLPSDFCRTGTRAEREAARVIKSA